MSAQGVSFVLATLRRTPHKRSLTKYTKYSTACGHRRFGTLDDKHHHYHSYHDLNKSVSQPSIFPALTPNEKQSQRVAISTPHHTFRSFTHDDYDDPANSHPQFQSNHDDVIITTSNATHATYNQGIDVNSSTYPWIHPDDAGRFFCESQSHFVTSCGGKVGKARPESLHLPLLFNFTTRGGVKSTTPPSHCRGVPHPRRWYSSDTTQKDTDSDGEKQSSETRRSQIEKVVKRIRQKREEDNRFVGYGTIDEDHVDTVQDPLYKQLMTKEYWRVMWGRIKNGVHHTKMGFKLLWTDTKIGTSLLRRVLHGEILTRRERNQLVRVGTDLFRLVPFSVFILVPFGELALPFAIKLFPGLLPTQFRDKDDQLSKSRGELGVKIEMARFLQETVENMALEKADFGQNKHGADITEFIQLLDKGRNPNVHVPTAEILKFSSLFEDVVTLDYLSRAQLRAICRLLMLNPVGSNAFLALQIRMKLREIHADDLLIQGEGVHNLSELELQAACRERGMRALGVSVPELRFRLEQWLTLHLRERVPTSLLLLTRLLYLPDNLNTSEQLAAAINSLPDSAKLEVKLAAVEAEAKTVTSFEDKLEIITEQQQLIENERELKKLQEESILLAKENKKREMEEKALQELEHPFVCTHDPQCNPDEDFQRILAKIEAKTGEIESERAALQKLKEKEQNRKEALIMLHEESQGEIVVSSGATNLGKQVQKMIQNLTDSVESSSEKDEAPKPPLPIGLKLDLDSDGHVTCAELTNALKTLAMSLKDEEIIENLVAKLDSDGDGMIDVDKLAQVWVVLRDVSLEQGKELQALRIAADAFQKEELVSEDKQEKVFDK
eukprot:m.136167 g.136167  ORF g.136167 m.136167 type:complete len:839 (+) comp29838_c0_seq2:312-2828(+)